ncbi:unnamed protein product [Fusarium langsethiae]|nr:unnamed protein product [Fusarium langsethiae]
MEPGQENNQILSSGNQSLVEKEQEVEAERSHEPNRCSMNNLTPVTKGTGNTKEQPTQRQNKPPNDENNVDESFLDHDMMAIMEPASHNQASDHQAQVNTPSDLGQGLHASDKPAKATAPSGKNNEDRSTQVSTSHDEPLAYKEEASELLTNHDMMKVMQPTNPEDIGE